MAAKKDELADLVIVGGGPAGVTTALRAAVQGASVTLVEKELSGGPKSRIGWLGPAGVSLCEELKLPAKALGASPFKGLRLHSWDLRRDAEIDDAELSGWVVDRAVFGEALREMAARAGVSLLRGEGVEQLAIPDDRVDAQLSNGRVVSGRVLVIADGTVSTTARMANILAAGNMPGVGRCAFAECQADSNTVGVEVAVGASRTAQTATIMRCGKMVGLAVAGRGDSAPVDQLYCEFRTAAVEAGLLPKCMPESPQQCPSPGGLALDIDTHVGKRCLMVGDAGGFVASFSNEGIYPAMRAGWIAADTALKALKEPVVQDALLEFGPAWRQELADYLRMPNTDLSLLVPLVFNNEQMARRVARAFLLGQPF